MEISYLVCLIFGVIIVVETIYIITEIENEDSRFMKRLEKIYNNQMKSIKNESNRVTSFTLQDDIHVSKDSLEYKVCLLFLEDLVKSGRTHGNLSDAYFYHEAILKIFFDDNFIEFYSQKDENGDYKYKEIFNFLKGEIKYDRDDVINFPLCGIKNINSLSILYHALNDFYQEYRCNNYKKEQEEEE